MLAETQNQSARLGVTFSCMRTDCTAISVCTIQLKSPMQVSQSRAMGTAPSLEVARALVLDDPALSFRNASQQLAWSPRDEPLSRQVSHPACQACQSCTCQCDNDLDWSGSVPASLVFVPDRKVLSTYPEVMQSQHLTFRAQGHRVMLSLLW